MKITKYKGKKEFCDAHVGVDYSQRAPRIIRCNNKPVFRLFKTDDKFCIPAFLCADCCEKIRKKYE